MEETKKPKRKYTRRQVAPMAVYSVLVTIKRGRKSETIYAERATTENGCLVVVSMDGPAPLSEKVRYIPLASAEIEVCRRPNYLQPTLAPRPIHMERDGAGSPVTYAIPDGPQIQPGPLEILRQRQAQPRPQTSGLVERNPDGVPVITAGFLDGSPT